MADKSVLQKRIQNNVKIPKSPQLFADINKLNETYTFSAEFLDKLTHIGPDLDKVLPKEQPANITEIYDAKEYLEIDR